MPQRDRILGVDLARGIALLGMVAVHVLPAERNGSVTLSHEIAGGRSAALFAVLAGVGLALAYGRRPGPRDAAALALRAVLIAALGLLLGLLSSGVAVILAYYGVFFLLVLPWLRAGPGLLAVSALLVAVVVPFLSRQIRDELPERDASSPVPSDVLDPAQLGSELLLTGYYPAAVWVAYLLAGLAVGRLALRSRRTAAVLAAAGAALAVLAHGASALLLRWRDDEQLTDEPRYGTVPTDDVWWLAVDAAHSGTPLDLLATTGSSLLVLGLCLLLGSPLLAPLAAAGSMPLTLYSAHVLLLATTDGDDPVRYYLLQVAAGLAFAMLWRRAFGTGPLEAAVAAATRRVRGSRT